MPGYAEDMVGPELLKSIQWYRVPMWIVDVAEPPRAIHSSQQRLHIHPPPVVRRRVDVALQPARDPVVVGPSSNRPTAIPIRTQTPAPQRRVRAGLGGVSGHRRTHTPAPQRAIPHIVENIRQQLLSEGLGRHHIWIETANRLLRHNGDVSTLSADQWNAWQRLLNRYVWHRGTMTQHRPRR
jgi:hypothetical protein